jgi:HEAT repeat protein
MRYWGATGILILKDAARSAIPALKEAADDESGAVATLVAEALYGLGEKEAAIRIYTKLLQDTSTYTMTDRNFALNSIDAINDESQEIMSAVQKMYNDQTAAEEEFGRYSEYDILMSEYLLKKWGKMD